ncbi:MAG: acetoacetate--CoA ligase [Methanomassiliicoccales archaeon]|nr:MAG: acetoacetate--CoA ligase [Methanomassiliicoccales archaeon]
MAKMLWEPSEEQIKNANMTKFMNFVNDRHGLNFGNYFELYDWSINNIPDFWAAMWDFSEIKASSGYESVVEDLGKFPGTKWFVGARLNYAENLLRFRDDHTAFIFKGEEQKSAKISYFELYKTVARLAASLRDMGVTPGDRVVGYMPNMIETACAMLAATSCGAIWASSATDIGPNAALDRFGQIEPKVMFTADGYYYKGRTFSTLSNAVKVVEGIPSIEKLVVVPYTEDEPDIGNISKAVHYNEFLSSDSKGDIKFEQLPSDHPVYIMFSSGTTGKPKCMVQGAAGLLVNHLKELVLHTDLRKADVHWFITTASWMMWNWMMSSLATGNTLVLYDGNPNYPDPSTTWKLIEKEKVSMFGCSATYINFLRSQNIKPKEDFDLLSLREIWQTGSVLLPEGFEYVYREIKEDLHFNSSSGGTDINGCFCTGSPIQPVYAGELQGPGLGMKINSYDVNGKPVVDGQGELVCEAPAPPMPLYFWNDPDGKKYYNAYFGVYPGVWRHGDYVLFNSKTRGVIFFGRSDSLLMPSGVRIGTSEIYNQVEELPEVADSLAIGQRWQEDQRIILFVKPAPGYHLTEDLVKKIKVTLRKNASPRHVPAMILEAPDIPYTFSGKKVESAVTNIINGKAVTNRDALANPESLDYYEDIVKELEK